MTQRDQNRRQFRKITGLAAFDAVLGDGNGTINEPGRKGYVRIREIIGSESDEITYGQYQIVRAFHTQAGNYPVWDGSPVKIGYDFDQQLAILGANTGGLIEGGFNIGALNTADSRLYGYQPSTSYLPLLSHAVNTATTASTKIAVRDWFYIDEDNQLQRWPGGLVDVSGDIPASGQHRYVLIALTYDRTLTTVAGTAKSVVIPLTTTDIQEVLDMRPPNSIPVSVWKLADNQSSVRNRDMVQDLRERINYPVSTSLPTLPNPVDYPTRIPAGRQTQFWGSVTITDNLRIDGAVRFEEPTTASASLESAEYTADEASDYTTTSTTFVDVDGTNFSLTITTNGGDVMVGFDGTIQSSASAARGFLEIDIDGSPLAGDDGILSFSAESTGHQNVSFVRFIPGLSAGSHTFKLQWKSDGVATLTLFAGAGTSEADTHPQFYVKELS